MAFGRDAGGESCGESLRESENLVGFSDSAVPCPFGRQAVLKRANNDGC